MRIGAHYLGDNRCEFLVWAPQEEKMLLRLLDPEPREVELERLERGYWRAEVENVRPGDRYVYLLDGERERPDPATFHQPQGVHNPSAVVDHRAFAWSDGAWRGRPLAELVIYELHVGAFTPEGTFAAVIPRLAELRELGVTAIEIMPVSQFPGERNWGYDGVHPFAPQNSYGGPEGLKQLVDACHRTGLAVILDVVYNHFGPEGNYLREFGPYFTAKYHTPWGDAVNFDDAGSDEVRHYFIENALYWLRDYHIDALRLDATDRIYDFSATLFLQELAREVHAFARETGRHCLLIVENDLNDARIIRPLEEGGVGMDGQWSDDFHHALHALLTGEDAGYYQDYGRAADLADAYSKAFVYDWRYSRYRDHRRGSSADGRPAQQFVVCSQNHDQVGNRMFGHRLISLSSFEAAKAAAGAVLLSPFVPLLFMGEEYGEQAPFQYFVHLLEEDLIAAVRQGRKEEFSAFAWRGEAPDPQSEETFARSRLRWEKRYQGQGKVMLDWYRSLLRLRRELPALRRLDREALQAGALEEEKIVWVRRRADHSEVLLLLNLNQEEQRFPLPAAPPWTLLLDSAAEQWQGPGSRLPRHLDAAEAVMPPHSCALLQRS